MPFERCFYILAHNQLHLCYLAQSDITSTISEDKLKCVAESLWAKYLLSSLLNFVQPKPFQMLNFDPQCLSGNYGALRLN